MAFGSLSRLALVPLLLLLPFNSLTVTAQDESIIWFFGNSYTQYGAMPGFARCWYSAWSRAELGISDIETPAYTPGGATLGSHIAYLRDDPDAPFFMDGQDYPWVVLQEQSIYPSVPDLLEDSLRWAGQLSFFFWVSQVRDVMFFMTWGRRGGFGGSGVEFPDFPSHNQALLEGYMAMVEETSTPTLQRYLAPCGLTFETIYNDCVERNVDPLNETECLFPKLYDNDGSHPSRLGSYACGATIGVAMTGIDPMPHECYPRRGVQLDEGEAAMVRNAVARTIIETFNSGLIVYPFDTLWPGWEATTAATPPPTDPPTTNPPTDAPTDPPTTDPPTEAPTDPPTTNSPTSRPTNPPTDRVVTMSPTVSATEGATAIGTLNSTQMITTAMTASPTFQESAATAVEKDGDSSLSSPKDPVEAEETDSAVEEGLMSDGGESLFVVGSGSSASLLVGWCVLLGQAAVAFLLA